MLEARQVALDRMVAVKCLLEGREAHAPVLVREARIASRLEHPNIISVHGLGVDASGQPMVVMKRLEGSSWRAILEAPDHPLAASFGADPMDRNLRILLQVCQAVHFAHERGVLHRDLKPDNVMLGSYGEIQVVDWGLAIELEGGRTQGLAGTPGYLAPEMVCDGAPVDARTDVYLLGAILHELITGTRRHRGSDLKALCAAAHHSAPASYGPTVPTQLATIANTACARDPVDRFPTAAALRQAIEAYLEQRASHALTSAALGRLEALERAAPDAIEELFGACRFGFEEALRIWPRDEAARSGLQQALVFMIEHDLSRGEAGAASRLAKELPSPDPLLTARVEQARQQLAQLHEGHDPTRGARPRLWAHLAFAGIVGVVPLVVGPLRRLGVVPPAADPGRRWLMPLIVATLLGLYVWRSQELWHNAYNRKILLLLWVILGSSSVMWLLASASGGTYLDVIPRLMVLVAAVGFCAGFLLDRRYLPAGAVMIAGGLAAGATGAVEEILGASNLLAIGWLAYSWSGLRRPT